MNNITLNNSNINTNTDADNSIEIIKQAIKDNNIMLNGCEYGESFCYVVTGDDEQPSKSFTYKVKEYVSLATIGAIVKEALDICYNDKFGYKAYLVEFAFKRTFMKYFTDFPVAALSYDEMYMLIERKDTSLFEYQMGDLSTLAQYDEAFQMLRNEIAFKKDIEIHKSKTMQMVDKFVYDIANVNNTEILGITMNALVEEVRKRFAITSIKSKSDDIVDTTEATDETVNNNTVNNNIDTAEENGD